ncbi:MAG TPA: hypothetical protein VGB98_07950 [Pyrinomonadaceae bacterium]|jgi:hypothetical protein
MKTSPTPADANAPAARPGRERGERGAALIMALLMTMLLLAAGGALILTSSMAATTAVDATAEMQAYYAAEAGLEAALAVVRRNVAPTTAGTEADFRTIVCGTAASCTNTGRDFSDWLTYTGGVVSLGNNLSYTLSVRDASVAAGAALPNSPYSPRFLLITSTGRGPKGATKVLEMTVDNFPFDFTARAAIAVRSNDDDDTGMAAFTLGSSNPHEWTGNDLAEQAGPLPAFTVTNTADYDAGDGFGSSTAQGTGEAAIDSDNENVSGRTVLDKLDPADLETWLQDANQARAFITSMRAKAASSGRLNPTNGYGTEDDPQFTFVDGDAGGNGAGLMIVTGTWSQGGSTKFHGIVLALGEGNFARNGNPDTIGALVVANFDHTWNTTSQSYTGTGGFGSPRITTAGGGNSTVGYHSEWVRKAMDTLGCRVTGIVEK